MMLVGALWSWLGSRGAFSLLVSLAVLLHLGIGAGERYRDPLCSPLWLLNQHPVRKEGQRGTIQHKLGDPVVADQMRLTQSSSVQAGRHRVYASCSRTAFAPLAIHLGTLPGPLPFPLAAPAAAAPGAAAREPHCAVPSPNWSSSPGLRFGLPPAAGSGSPAFFGLAFGLTYLSCSFCCVGGESRSRKTHAEVEREGKRRRVEWLCEHKPVESSAFTVSRSRAPYSRAPSRASRSSP